jgi:hypothetical protein
MITRGKVTEVIVEKGREVLADLLDARLPARYNQPGSKQVLTTAKKTLRGVNI